ncbi:MAG: long-chain-fatty-acid--CoA ligase [Alphaproteobacteria bacterium]|nr:long-chain-fatty-acid--CoA ligase [Alphaproteobacteria bacterium]
MAGDEIRSLADLARVQARRQGDAVAFEFEDRITTFAALDRQSNQIANALIAAGLTPGDRVAYIGKNTDRYFELLCAVAKARGVLAPVNWRLAKPEIAYIVNDCRAKFLVVGAEFLDLANALRPDLASVTTFISAEAPHPDFIDYAAFRGAQPTDDPGGEPGWEEVALQLYTSGTTGHPKGAMLPSRGFLALRRTQEEANTQWNKWTSDDVSLVAMPCFHIGGTGWGVTGLYYGAKGVIMREFDPSKVLDFFVRYGITKLFMVPAAMQIVLNQPHAREVDYSRLKYLLYGASPIPLDLLREAMAVFKCGFVQMYGMTETTGTICALPPEDHDPNGGERMRSAGKALPGVEIAILDEAGKALPPRAVGEIATRSAANMTGYWNLAEATAATIDDQNWLRTGDAGYLDEDGYLYVHDRVKDMIISGGENIYPAEVESAIYGHPAVADVAVIGVPDEKWGEAVKAMVVLKTGATATPADVIGFARERIAGYKCPKSVDFIDALPRNPSGKILRRELRAPFWQGRARQVN